MRHRKLVEALTWSLLANLPCPQGGAIRALEDPELSCHVLMVTDCWLSPETRPSHSQRLLCSAQSSGDVTECNEPRGGFSGVISESQPFLAPCLARGLRQ